jgi:hypothetical protein
VSFAVATATEYVYLKKFHCCRTWAMKRRYR